MTAKYLKVSWYINLADISTSNQGLVKHRWQVWPVVAPGRGALAVEVTEVLVRIHDVPRRTVTVTVGLAGTLTGYMISTS